MRAWPCIGGRGVFSKRRPAHEDCIPARSFLSTRSSRLRNLIFLCAFLREHMCVGGCEQISFVRCCCCEVLLSGFRVSDCEQVQEVGFLLTDRFVQGCHTGRPEAFWRANRAGGQAALSITPYMNRAGYCRQRNYCSKFTLLW
jgi:hypothetical protein